jgi:Myb-like DNA-binding domain
VAEKGSRWKEIGGCLGRLPTACRDRWREVRLGDDRHRGKWTYEEEERLRMIVNECLDDRQVLSAAPAAAPAGITEMRILLMPSRDQMSYSACQIRPRIFFLFQCFAPNSNSSSLPQVRKYNSDMLRSKQSECVSFHASKVGRTLDGLGMAAPALQ